MGLYMQRSVTTLEVGMSKGSKPRPISDRKKFEENWDKIFNDKKQVEPKGSVEEKK